MVCSTVVVLLPVVDDKCGPLFGGRDVGGGGDLLVVGRLSNEEEVAIDVLLLVVGSTTDDSRSIVEVFLTSNVPVVDCGVVSML